MTRVVLFVGLTASAIADPRCCYSKFGDDTSCGGYPSSAVAGICNTDYRAPCSSNADCAQVPSPTPSPLPTPVPGPTPIPSPVPSTGKCCWSLWGDASTCTKYPAGATGPICGNDGVTSCQSDGDCVATPAPSPAPVPTTTAVVDLNNGVEMPVMAFAAQSYWPPDTCSNATALALQAGFRFVWSSSATGLECQRAQGAAIAAADVPRSELFIAGTVAPGSVCQGLDSCYTQTKSDAEAQFDILGVDKLDMLMLEFPSSSGCVGIRGQWQAFEEFYAAGRVRTIAVSNFETGQMQCVVDTNGTVPSVNMLHYNVADSGHSRKVADNARFGTVVQAFSPLEGGDLVTDELCASIGEGHGKSAVQVALKWILQTNATVATQSTRLSHLVDDMNIFDFTLRDDEVSQLNNHYIAQAFVIV